jgi:SAM-dependent methyltransferase
MTDEPASDILYKDYFAGRKLYGDDFSSDLIRKWFEDEEEAYFNLAQDISEYQYHVFNLYYGYRHLRNLHFDTCLAIGCSDGDDVKPLSCQVKRYVALEPAEKWWRNEIGGKPALFVKPLPTGEINLDDATIDLAVCLGVMHHIPNVSFVIKEIARVLRPEGLLILREPIFSMGDWRLPRKGLTKRERGIPPHLLLEMLTAAGLTIIHEVPCMVPLTPRLAHLMGIKNAYNSKAMVVLDRVLSLLLKWNMRYHRTNILRKLAPTSLFVVAQRN